VSVEKTLVVDIDGTLCEQTLGGTDYALAGPRKDVITAINLAYVNGWKVVLYTARGMSTLTAAAADRAYRLMTEEWLEDHEVMYQELRFGKPPATYYVDDKAMRPDEFVEFIDCQT